MQINCDDCAYFEYDDEDEMYYCSVNMDEDDYARLLESGYRNCPYYRNWDEYMAYYTTKRVQRNLNVKTPLEYHEMVLREVA